MSKTRIARIEALEQLDREPPPPPDLLSFTPEQILGPIEPERYALPGVPLEAYTLIAGALSSFKTSLLLYLLTWKASGWDLLELDAKGTGVDIGKALLLTYEDTDRRILAKLQRVIQQGHEIIKRRFSERDAQEFAARAAANLRRLSLTGNVNAGLVHRVAGMIVPNEAFVTGLIAAVQQLAPEGGAVIGLDPLRLAIAGSQSDDDGADIVVHTLNRIAAQTGSALVVCSHSTKAGAQEPGSGYAASSYATAGSALYSQHARSNFHMARLSQEETLKLFDRTDVTEEQARGERVVRLAHGRDSHGPEREGMYLLMGAGVLTPVEPGAAKGTPEILRAAAPHLIAAIDRMKADSVRATAKALEADQILRKTLSRDEVRTALQLLLENGHLEATGGTSNRDITVTPTGRNLVKPPDDNRESPRETHD
jgi:AAA domain